MSLFVAEGEDFDAVAGSMSLRSIPRKVGQVTGPALVGVVWDLTNAFVAFAAASGFLLFAAGVFAMLYTLEPGPEVAVEPRD